MRAMRIGQAAGLEHLMLSESAQPTPGAGEILVRVRASSLNYHDYLVATGGIPTTPGRIPMSDGAGEVVAVGPAGAAGSPQFKVGDRVMGTFFRDWSDGDLTPDRASRVHGEQIDGYACDYVAMPAGAFTLAPRGYSHEEAATLPCAGLTAWRALICDGPLKPGEVVLVQGTGGVSIFALQFAKAAGAVVIATSSSDEKLERLKTLGADHVINYKTQEKWGKAAKEWTGGRGVDHVVEVGGSGTLAQSMTAVRLGGHIALIGVLAGMEGKVSTVRLMAGQIRLQGVTVGSRAHQTEMVRGIDANGLRPVIDKSFPLEGMADAFRHQASGKHFGKICLGI